MMERIVLPEAGPVNLDPDRVELMEWHYENMAWEETSDLERLARVLADLGDELLRTPRGIYLQGLHDGLLAAAMKAAVGDLDQAVPFPRTLYD